MDGTKTWQRPPSSAFGTPQSDHCHHETVAGLFTDAGLAQLVARLDKPLLLEEDVRGERRRMERVTNGAVAEHSSDRWATAITPTIFGN